MDMDGDDHADQRHETEAREGTRRHRRAEKRPAAAAGAAATEVYRPANSWEALKLAARTKVIQLAMAVTVSGKLRAWCDGRQAAVNVERVALLRTHNKAARTIQQLWHIHMLRRLRQIGPRTLQIIRTYAWKARFNVAVRRRVRLANVLRSYMRCFHQFQSAKFVYVVNRFRWQVVVLQRAAKAFLACKAARVAALERKWERTRQASAETYRKFAYGLVRRLDRAERKAREAGELVVDTGDPLKDKVEKQIKKFTGVDITLLSKSQQSKRVRVRRCLEQGRSYPPIRRRMVRELVETARKAHLFRIKQMRRGELQPFLESDGRNLMTDPDKVRRKMSVLWSANPNTRPDWLLFTVELNLIDFSNLVERAFISSYERAKADMLKYI